MALFIEVLIGLYFAFNAGCIFFLIFFEKGKESPNRLGWILALCIPFIGLFFFVLFSGNFFTKNQKMERAKEFGKTKFLPVINEQKQILKENYSSLSETMQKYISLINMNLEYGKSIICFNDSFRVFIFGQQKFEALCKDLENAEYSINMEYFIFHNDKIGSKIMNILCRKAKEGIKVKLMYDDLGSMLTPQYFFERLNRTGGEARPFFPIRRGTIFSVNFRNHRKIAVIDGKIGYLGGMNIGDEYANQSEIRKILWRDTHIRLTGGSVTILQSIFLMDWYSICYSDKFLFNMKKNSSCYFPMLNFENITTELSLHFENHIRNSNADVPIQIVTSAPHDKNTNKIREALIKIIRDAKSEICIQTPYFVPDNVFYSALKIAALSGIKIMIMVPGRWDKPYVKAASLTYMRELSEYGITFYQYPGFIHSKTIVADDEILSIGSTNIDPRSFSLHFEINAFVFDRKQAHSYRDTFMNDLRRCIQFLPEEYDRYSIFTRAIHNFCRLFSPLM